MIHITTSFVCWNYYIALEDDLKKISRYIEFNDDNFKTYSIELAHLLLATSSEVDVLLKALCKLLVPNCLCRNINDYKRVIKEKLPDFISETIYIPRHGIINVQPWENWNSIEDANPYWWKAYNDVKHQRDINFNKANLQHTINSIGALLITNFYYYKTLFQQHEGRQYNNKEVTEKLFAKDTFVQLSKNYYYDILLT